jgi:hypothetical protein
MPTFGIGVVNDCREKQHYARSKRRIFEIEKAAMNNQIATPSLSILFNEWIMQRGRPNSASCAMA